METDDSIEEPIGSGVISTADDSIAIIPAEAATIDQPLRILKKKIKKLQFKKTPLSSTEDEDSMANLVEAKARASAMIAPSKEEKMEEWASTLQTMLSQYRHLLKNSDCFKFCFNCCQILLCNN